jgi:low affinity Fe/Cu permease
MHEAFRKFSFYVSKTIGSAWAFIVLIISVWASGYYFGYSDKWKINVSFIAAVITLAALIFLQRSQNHNDDATHLKLDEIVRAMEGARNEVVSVEEQSGKDLNRLKKNIEADNRDL